MAQQQNTHLQCGNACWDGGYANIVAMAMEDYVAYILRPCLITEFYMSQIGNYPFQQTFCFVNFDLNI